LNKFGLTTQAVQVEDFPMTVKSIPDKPKTLFGENDGDTCGIAAHEHTTKCSGASSSSSPSSSSSS
jgi:hypothetical protein